MAFLALVALFGLLVVVLGTRTRWRGGVRVEQYRATLDGSTMTLCASGHFDQGLFAEVLSALGSEPTDNGLSQCVHLAFRGAPAPGTYRLLGEGHRLVMERGGPPDFTPRAGHSPEIERAWLENECFCMDSDEPSSFDGTLTLTALDPPRGHFSLELPPGPRSERVSIDASLGAFTWTSNEGY